MPPISVHFAFGVVAAAIVARRLKRREDRGPLALGIIAGSVVVDADLLVSSIAALVTGGTEAGKLIHRTLTHSVPFNVALAAFGAWLTRSRERRAWGIGLMGFAASALFLHALPDGFYLVGVKYLFPFSLHEWHFGPFALDRFSDAQNNVINGLDFMSESIVWLFAWWAAREYGLESRFSRMLPWFALVNGLVYAAETAIVAPTVSYDEFLYWAYYPGFLNIVVSTLLVPLLMWRVWVAWGEGPPPRRVSIGRASRASAAP